MLSALQVSRCTDMHAPDHQVMLLPQTWLTGLWRLAAQGLRVCPCNIELGLYGAHTLWMAMESSGPSKIALVPLSMTTAVAATLIVWAATLTPLSPTVQYLHAQQARSVTKGDWHPCNAGALAAPLKHDSLRSLQIVSHGVTWRCQAALAGLLNRD